MFRNISGVFLLLFALLSEAQENELQNQVADKITNAIYAIDGLNFEGTVLIVSNDSIVFERNFNLDSNVNYSYWLGSLSKQFCATAILKLQETGKLNVTDSIGDIFSDLPSGLRSITIHQLLTHSSGLGDHYSADGVANAEKALKKITNRTRDKSGQYLYSSDGYQLLALIVEKVSGIAYEDFLHQFFFQPFGMKETSHAADGRTLVEYFAWNKKVRKLSHPQTWSTNYGFKGATGIISSCKDLHIWKKALLEGKVLNELNLQLLLSRHVAKRQIYYGYGWNLYDSKYGQVMMHSGDDDFIDHNATLRHYLDINLTLIVLSNGGYLKGVPKSSTVSSAVLDIVLN